MFSRLMMVSAALLLSGSGCSVAPPVSTGALLRQQALLDFTGLLPAQPVDNLKVSWAVPRDWEALPDKRGLIYTHQQYRSPSGFTGVGVAYVRLPIPVPPSTLAWLAQREYAKRNGEDRDNPLLSRWTDSAGREWFEVENHKYHGTGYVMTQGREAWVIYSGYRVQHAPRIEEINVSRRSAQTIVPINN